MPLPEEFSAEKGIIPRKKKKVNSKKVVLIFLLVPLTPVSNKQERGGGFDHPLSILVLKRKSFQE